MSCALQYCCPVPLRSFRPAHCNCFVLSCPLLSFSRIHCSFFTCPLQSFSSVHCGSFALFIAVVLACSMQSYFCSLHWNLLVLLIVVLSLCSLQPFCPVHCSLFALSIAAFLTCLLQSFPPIQCSLFAVHCRRQIRTRKRKWFTCHDNQVLCPHCDISISSKKTMLFAFTRLFWFNVGPPSQTVAQH